MGVSGRRAMKPWLAMFAILATAAVPRAAGADSLLGPGNWRRVLGVPQGTIGGSEGFSDVSCPEPNWCMAVGYGRNQTYSSVWAGGSWTDGSYPPTDDPVFGYLGGYGEVQHVACRSSSDCFAAGSQQAADGTTVSLLDHWDGGTWQRVDTSSVESSAFGQGAGSLTRITGLSCQPRSPFSGIDGYFSSLQQVPGLNLLRDGRYCVVTWVSTRGEEQIEGLGMIGEIRPVDVTVAFGIYPYRVSQPSSPVSPLRAPVACTPWYGPVRPVDPPAPGPTGFAQWYESRCYVGEGHQLREILLEMEDTYVDDGGLRNLLFPRTSGDRMIGLWPAPQAAPGDPQWGGVTDVSCPGDAQFGFSTKDGSDACMAVGATPNGDPVADPSVTYSPRAALLKAGSSAVILSPPRRGDSAFKGVTCVRSGGASQGGRIVCNAVGSSVTNRYPTEKNPRSERALLSIYDVSRNRWVSGAWGFYGPRSIALGDGGWTTSKFNGAACAPTPTSSACVAVGFDDQRGSNPLHLLVAASNVPLSVNAATTTLPPARRSTPLLPWPYSWKLAAAGGSPPYRWSTAYILPKGLRLTSDGTIQGIVPQEVEAADYTFGVTVRDADGQEASAELTLKVLP